jgi:hypothetical protein
MNTVQ